MARKRNNQHNVKEVAEVQKPQQEVVVKDAVEQPQEEEKIVISEEEALREEITILRHTIAGLKGANTERGKKIKQLEEEIFTKKRVIADLESRISIHVNNIEVRDVEIKKLKSAIKNLQGELFNEKHKTIWERIIERFR